MIDLRFNGESKKRRCVVIRFVYQGNLRDINDPPSLSRYTPYDTRPTGWAIDLTITTAPALMPHIQSGKFRPLLVAGRKRSSSLPKVQTALEEGVKNFEVEAWFALYTHAQAPKSAVERVSKEVQKIMSTAAFK